MKEQNIKIYVTYKNREPIIQSEIVSPIQTGRAIAADIFREMIGDDTGDNISDKNPTFSELSAMYWVWKNYDSIGNPDYIGFMHYRRQFIFNEKLGIPFPKWTSSFYYFPSLHEAIPYFADEEIKRIVPHYDLLIPKYSVTPTLNIKDEYTYMIPGSRADIFDTFIKICREIHPTWEEEIKRVERGNVVALCNMFVMKRELFFEYCNFAFPVLFELEKRVDKTNLSTNGLRFCGYMAEKLQTMFTFRLEKDPNLKEKFLNCTWIRHDVRRNDLQKIPNTDTFSELRKNLDEVHFPNIKRCFEKNEKEIKLLFIINHSLYFKLLEYRYWICMIFTFAKRRTKYQTKFESIKLLRKEARMLKKNLYRI